MLYRLRTVLTKEYVNMSLQMSTSNDSSKLLYSGALLTDPGR